MTEQEWLAASDPGPLLEYLEPRSALPLAPLRKRYLFACACCRRAEHLLGDEKIRKALEAAEENAEGKMKYRLADAWRRTAQNARHLSPQSWQTDSPEWRAYRAVECAFFPDKVRHPHHEIRVAAATATGAHHLSNAWKAAYDAEAAAMADLLRDIVGNPFRLVKVESAWQTANVVGIAQGIYDERGFDRMPILADALEETGCTNADVLNHCCQPGIHGRGCWVVDLLLGKS